MFSFVRSLGFGVWFPARVALCSFPLPSRSCWQLALLSALGCQLRPRVAGLSFLVLVRWSRLRWLPPFWRVALVRFACRSLAARCAAF